jgi:hypothetical protein
MLRREHGTTACTDLLEPGTRAAQNTAALIPSKLHEAEHRPTPHRVADHAKAKDHCHPRFGLGHRVQEDGVYVYVKVEVALPHESSPDLYVPQYALSSTILPPLLMPIWVSARP